MTFPSSSTTRMVRMASSVSVREILPVSPAPGLNEPVREVEMPTVAVMVTESIAVFPSLSVTLRVALKVPASA